MSKNDRIKFSELLTFLRQEIDRQNPFQPSANNNFRNLLIFYVNYDDATKKALKSFCADAREFNESSALEISIYIFTKIKDALEIEDPLDNPPSSNTYLFKVINGRIIKYKFAAFFVIGLMIRSYFDVSGFSEIADNDESSKIEQYDGLKIDKERNRFCVNCTWFDLTTAQGKMISLLWKAAGAWVKGSDIDIYSAQILQKLPKIIRDEIEGDKHRGYRLKRFLPK
jgi:hypothetical protein